MKDSLGDNYWEFTTNYIRRAVDFLTDWEHPENDSKDLPPIGF